jgi:hypothetical protein
MTPIVTGVARRGSMFAYWITTPGQPKMICTFWPCAFFTSSQAAP